ncbi:glycosyltransferase family 8 protein [Noviherbaspirillum pedocola]|uniref:Glycosyltransferase n=1 Tax=Noviherbaspirillum pedocola TaxID=2801341 RepID=A0A934W549_9BURK|nr:glycosyltransferase [Noviherbaspirillum pedocola]MBK4733510.1 glycosyltransferase [Noviherbaspirillum pedocola]
MSFTPSSHGTNPVHIAFGVDAGYYRGMGVAITSIIENNPKRRFIFHVFAFTVTAEDRDRLRALEEKHGQRIEVHQLDTGALDAFRRFPCFSQHSLGTFIRLLIPEGLRGVTDRVLYLDADLLCFGDISDLLQTDLGDCIAAAVTDEQSTTVSTQVPALGLKHGQYFNAGVMLIDIERWVAADVSDIALKALSMRELRFADQDALNIALDGRVRYVDAKWNYRYHLVDYLDRGETRLNVGPSFALMHFTGPVKPWHDWCLHEVRCMFLELQSRSPWAGMPLDAPRTARELKLFSRFLMRQNRIVESISWHCRYLRARLRQKRKSA